jgi:hypothetical protein
MFHRRRHRGRNPVACHNTGGDPNDVIPLTQFLGVWPSSPDSGEEELTDHTTQYPCHLARLVSHRLLKERGSAPPERVLVQLLETLYFASFQTDEGRKILCTVDFVDPNEVTDEGRSG